jgi:hypothetical protein
MTANMAEHKLNCIGRLCATVTADASDPSRNAIGLGFSLEGAGFGPRTFCACRFLGFGRQIHRSMRHTPFPTP